MLLAEESQDQMRLVMGKEKNVQGCFGRLSNLHIVFIHLRVDTMIVLTSSPENSLRK